MGLKFDLEQIVSQVGRDKGISKQVLIHALESAVLSAAKKHYGHGRNLEASYNLDLGEIEVIEFRTVVDEVRDPQTQITLDQARADFDPDCEVGDELGKKLDAQELGRIAAQTAKQVIIQKLRDAERDIIYDEFKDRKGELVNGIVQRVERNGILVNLGRTDAILPDREQIHRERYRQGDRVRAMILDIYSVSRGPQVVLTRSHPDFMRKLFELNVPEINEKIVEIKSVAREPGERAKIAVYSTDPNVDPVGACVGIKGSRVRAVVSELRGENVDIIQWSPDSPSFVARALQPAEVKRVVIDDDEHSMEVVVSDEQLSLAIGKRGQNVKLASKLTGWKIDVRSESIADEETRRARKAIETIPGIGFGEAELIFLEGYRSVQQIAAADLSDIVSIDGLGKERAEEIYNAAKELAATLPEEETGTEISDLDKLNLDSNVKEMLVTAGLNTIQAIAMLRPDELAAQAEMDLEVARDVNSTVDEFLRVKKTWDL